MSLPWWVKATGLCAVILAAMVVGALALPSLGIGDGDNTPSATETPGAQQQVSNELTATPSATQGIANVPDGATLADVVESVAGSVVYIEGVSLGGGASGSGFVVDDDGHILTNYHVVEGLSEVKVIFADGSASRAEILGSDPSSDLAVIRAENVPEIATPVTFGDSTKVRPGDPVFAIGNPFQQRNTVTAGIVSAVDRTTVSSFTRRSIRNVIQVDAAVNPGNSGGPLFNYAGEVIGINTSIENPNGRFFVGLGFAVSSETATRVLPSLIAGEVVTYPRLGVEVSPVDEVIADSLGLAVDRGVYVTRVEPESAAARAGVRAAPSPTSTGGDVIVSVAGEPVSSFDDLARLIDQHKVGDQIEITVNRNGEELLLTAELQPWDME